VGAALLVSHGVRPDAQIVLYLRRGGRYVRVDGAAVKHLNPDERSTAALMAKALAADPVGVHEEEPMPGVFVGQGDLGDVLARVAGGRAVVRLDETGAVGAGAWDPEAVYVLSDHRDLTVEEEEAIEEHVSAVRSLGDDVVQADQAIVLVHDRVRRTR
jgi:tRNA (pseudouridine54-N1)-methyltransferase